MPPRWPPAAAAAAALAAPCLAAPRGDCAWEKITRPPTVGDYCSDFDVGRTYDPATTDPVQLGEQVCMTAPSSNTFDAASPYRSFFYGTFHGAAYVWCSNWCASGCCSGDFVAGYRRICAGQPTPPPAPPAPPPPATAPPDPATPMPAVDVPGAEARGALYPNGQPASYFMRRNNASAGYVIHLSGGGWRFMKRDPGVLGGVDAASAAGALTRDGQPAAGSGACYGRCDGILSDDPVVNPLFSEWNKIWVPISGTSFTGDRDSLQPYPVRGRRIQEAVIDDLLARHGMAAATNVILTGGSSGGLAVYLTCDRVGAQVRAANASTRYTCLPDAGFFLDHNSSAGAPSTSPQFRESFYAWNSSGGTNQACVAHYRPSGEEWRCIFAEYVAPFITSELFAMQNLYDSWQMANILRVGCSGYNKPLDDCNAAQMAAVQAYGADMRTALAPLSNNPAVGSFMPSCIAHCQSVENEHSEALWYWPERWGIDEGKVPVETPREAFDAWYTGKAAGAASKHVQQCDWSPVNCNKLCPDFT